MGIFSRLFSRTNNGSGEHEEAASTTRSTEEEMPYSVYWDQRSLESFEGMVHSVTRDIRKDVVVPVEIIEMIANMDLGSLQTVPVNPDWIKSRSTAEQIEIAEIWVKSLVDLASEILPDKMATLNLSRYCTRRRKICIESLDTSITDDMLMNGRVGRTLQLALELKSIEDPNTLSDDLLQLIERCLEMKHAIESGKVTYVVPLPLIHTMAKPKKLKKGTSLVCIRDFYGDIRQGDTVELGQKFTVDDSIYGHDIYVKNSGQEEVVRSFCFGVVRETI